MNSRLWLIPTGTSVSVTSSSLPFLRLTVVCRTPPSRGSASTMPSVSGSARPSMRAPGQPKSSSAGRLQRVTAPSRSVSTKRASTSWRSSSSTTSDVVVAAVVEFSDTPYVGRRRRARTRTRSAAGGLNVQVQSSPCSSAPLTPASSAFRRWSASASAERKRRPGRASGPWWPRMQWVSACSFEAGQPAGALVHELHPEREVADERTRLGQRDLGAELELADLPDVVQDRRAQRAGRC